MDQDLKERWVAALRSGDFVQTKGALHDDIGYCCLGVLCTLVPDVEFTPRDTYSGDSGDVFDARQNGVIVGRGALFGQFESELFGGDPHHHNPIVTQLIQLNDSGHSFEEIADVIEEKL